VVGGTPTFSGISFCPLLSFKIHEVGAVFICTPSLFRKELSSAVKSHSHITLYCPWKLA